MDAVIKDTIPSLVSEGVFGDYEFVSISGDSGEEFEPQFASELVSVNLKLCHKSGESKIIPLIIKIEPEQSSGRDFEAMFYDEIIMYEEILPFLNRLNVRRHPKMYYGKPGHGKDLGIVILENLKTSGFKPCRQKVVLDYEHIAVAMKAIAEFHSWSYISKAKDNERFHEVVKKLKPIKINEEEQPAFNGISMRKGINLYLTTGTEVDVVNKFLKTIENVKKFLEFVHAPTEPFAVVLHGDFCKNNVQYKYDENGSPTDCALFDFQTTKYGSPVVDLAFFLYMHTTQETRHHWDDYLKIYWTSVEENVSEEVQLPNFEEFLRYFASKAVLGYFPCSFYLPMMTFPEELLPAAEYMKLSPEEILSHFMNCGGEKGGKLIRDIVSHLVEKKYIHSFLDYYEQNQPY